MKDLQHSHRHLFRAGTGSNKLTLVLFHGTGGSEQEMVSLGDMLAPNECFLSIRGNVSENGMPRFFKRHSEGVFDIEDLHFRTREMASFLNEARHQYELSNHRFVAAGFSNGANIAASLLLSYPDTLQGAILLRPMLPFKPKSALQLDGKSVFISIGSKDNIAPPDQAEELGRLLKDYGANVQINWEASGHGLVRTEIDKAQKWLQQQYLASRSH